MVNFMLTGTEWKIRQEGTRNATHKIISLMSCLYKAGTFFTPSWQGVTLLEAEKFLGKMGQNLHVNASPQDDLENKCLQSNNVTTSSQ